MWKLGPAISVLENCLSHLVFLSSTSILSIVWCGTLCPCGHVLSGNFLVEMFLVEMFLVDMFLVETGKELLK